MDQLNKINTGEEELEDNVIRKVAGQEEMKNYIQRKMSDIQDKISADISAIGSGKTEFEVKITDELDTQL
jgi:hypothetical protein